MDENLSIKKLIEMLSFFPENTPFLNPPNKPYKYLDTENFAMVVGETIFDQNPTKTVGEILDWLKRIMANEYQVGIPVKEETLLYLVPNMHKAGEAVIGIKMTIQGITLIKAPRF